jgi:hypothetical protein
MTRFSKSSSLSALAALHAPSLKEVLVHRAMREKKVVRVDLLDLLLAQMADDAIPCLESQAAVGLVSKKSRLIACIEFPPSLNHHSRTNEIVFSTT